MSYAVANPRASSPSSGPPSSATVYDFICLFTHDLRRKQKRWQDGKLKYHSFNKKIMVYDDRGHFVGDGHWDQEGDLAPGDELSLDRGMALVQVEDCTGEKQQDLTELLDKRAREVEKRRQIAAAKTRPTPRASSLANGSGGAQSPAPRQQQQQQQQRPLSSLVQTPGRIGRAAIPAHSPFEARQQKPRLHQNSVPVDSQPTVAARPPPARKRQASPPSKAGFAKNLFGTSLSLSACPGPELMAARARVQRARMQSQMEMEASVAPREEEEAEEPQVMQSSPLFVEETEATTPSRPAKEPHATELPVTRPPITTARMAMREVEDGGNRNGEQDLEEDEEEEAIQQENPSKKRRKEAQRLECRRSPVSANIQDVQAEEEPKVSEIGSKRRKKDKELSQSRKQRASPMPISEAIIIDEESDEIVEEEPRRREPQQEKRVAAKTRPAKVKEPEKLAPETTEEPEQKKPRTTLRIRSRQRRGLLMLREPIEALPEPQQASPKMDMHERVAKTPSPEPVAPPPRIARSASPVQDEEGEENVVIPSSEPPAEKHSSPVSVIHMPVVASAQPVAESSSDDDLPPPPKRRATKRRMYSPAADPEHQSEDEPNKEPKSKRRLAKRMADDNGDNRDKPDEEEDEPQRTKRKRRATKPIYDEEPPGLTSEGEENTEAPAKVEGPRIARLARKGIRSKEILGYFPPGIENLIPGPFASAAFRLGGPPVVSAVRSEAAARSETPATASASCRATETTAPSLPPAPAPRVAAPTRGAAPTIAPTAAPTRVPTEPSDEVLTDTELSAPNPVKETSMVPTLPEAVPVLLEQEVAQVPPQESSKPAVAINLKTASSIMIGVTDGPNIVANVPGPPLLSRSSSNATALPLCRTASNASAPAAIEYNEAKLENETMTTMIPITAVPTKASAPALEKLLCRSQMQSRWQQC
ncbi:hypothetical protein NQ176_g9157 [Zarea fungicola]|uniref:Uncharacterized protein n=1 Tax=Zarea fungicola TaxID=93591 RepID=A0ACC1MNT4_9HYPO|nr:hypothetical protein NQ176_g9157 [Lecanicillium fungicola]